MEEFEYVPEKGIVTVDFKRTKSGSIGVTISFNYGINGFDLLLSAIRGCGGVWNKKIGKWVINGVFAFYCIDIISSIEEVTVIYSDYFKMCLKKEMRRLEKNIISSKSIKPSKKLDIPANPDKSYFEFQKAVVEFFNERGKNVLLADDMGVGKTVSAIAIANYNAYSKILVVCPDSAKDKVWKEHFFDWYVGNKDVSVIYAGKVFKPADVVIINFDLITKYEKQFSEMGFEYMIVDEAHMLKSTNTKRTLSIQKLSNKIPNKIFLTGTPILNRPIELYSLLKILAGSAFGSKIDFAFRHCDAKLVTIGGKPQPNWDGEVVETAEGEKKFLDDKGDSNLSELNFKLRSTIMMRREKADVINEFPKINRQVYQIEADYSDEIDKKYKEEKRRYTKEISNLKQKKSTFFDLKLYSKAIKQVHNYHFDRISAIRKELGVNKIPDIAKFVQALLDRGVKKIVLFLHHREVVDGVHLLFPNNSVVLYGGMTSREKTKAVNTFEQNDKINIFIGSIKASGVAYTLTAAHFVVFGELDWTPSMIDQCECRCARLGQKLDVVVFYLIVNNSLDQNMLEKTYRKGKVIKTVMI
jgi:SNF2 family DNA or RNA helicase